MINVQLFQLKILEAITTVVSQFKMMTVSWTSHNTNRGCLVQAFIAFLPWFCAFFHRSRPTYQQILLAQLPIYVQNSNFELDLTIPHYLHCYYCLSPGPLLNLSDWPQFHVCTYIHSPYHRVIILKHKLDLVIFLFKTL